MKMNFLHIKLVLLLVFVGLIGACKNTQKVDVENIEKLYVDYNRSDALNYSKPFTAEVVMKMYTSEEIILTKQKRFNSSENIQFDFTDKKATLNIIPSSFEKNYEVISLTLSDKNDMSITSTDTIHLNFNAGLSIGFAASNGAKGGKGSEGSTSTIVRSGRDGAAGLNGSNGLNGDAYEAHIWMEGDFYFIYLKNSTQNWVGKYKLHGTHALVLNAQGGNGGDGGDGGKGGTGKDGELKGTSTKLPGNGGNGGNGGHAGNGGAGGNVTVIIHPNAESIKPFLEIRNYGGFSGQAGTGGQGGNPGKPLSGQTQAKNGLNGLNGFNGQNGQAGTVSVQTVNFDPNLFY
jgi:hypothetical protein